MSSYQNSPKWERRRWNAAGTCRAEDLQALNGQVRVGRKIGGARRWKGKASWVSVSLLGGSAGAGTETKRGRGCG
uniref:Uncharacterized protein n=1 Tax=Cucumis melo TaxID=3656 RepID=A0A9I9CLA8_CUCME